MSREKDLIPGADTFDTVGRQHGRARRREYPSGPASHDRASSATATAPRLPDLGKPETFKFLGFTHICGQSRRGKFLLKRKTRRDRMRTKLVEIKEEMRLRMHQSIPEQGRWLAQVVRGFFAYHAVPTNFPALRAFHNKIKRLWLCTLRRRSQKDRTTWEQIKKIAVDYLPKPQILHPWPQQRFAVTHPRWEPRAGIPLARLCAGGGR